MFLLLFFLNIKNLERNVFSILVKQKFEQRSSRHRLSASNYNFKNSQLLNIIIMKQSRI